MSYIKQIEIKMPKIISKPGRWNSRCGDQTHRFAAYETMGGRRTQEDALAWRTFDDKELDDLTPVEIGHRLWTTYQNLHETLRTNGATAGSTASTTVVKGPHLITATLGDAVAFAVVYNRAGEIVRVQRLNEVTHKPNDSSEEARIRKAGGIVSSDEGIPRVGGLLAMSRTLGDFGVTGMCADAHIDIATLPADDYHVQIISACDGLTDGAGLQHQTKGGHEKYLERTLRSINAGKPGLLSERQLAEALAKKAIDDGSADNISVAVQTVKVGGQEASQHCMLGVYDGHSGTDVSHYAADQIDSELSRQLALSKEDYEAQATSVKTKKTDYERDNKDKETLNPALATEPLPSFLSELDTIITKLDEQIKVAETSATNQLVESGKLRAAAKKLITDLREATQAFKERTIGLDDYRERCAVAVDTCKTAFQNFRGNSPWEKYFGPLIRRLFACFDSTSQEKYELDQQVSKSVQKIAAFKTELECIKSTPPAPASSKEDGDDNEEAVPGLNQGGGA